MSSTGSAQASALRARWQLALVTLLACTRELLQCRGTSLCTRPLEGRWEGCSAAIDFILRHQAAIFHSIEMFVVYSNVSINFFARIYIADSALECL
jgi:hypothetical protein